MKDLTKQILERTKEALTIENIKKTLKEEFVKEFKKDRRLDAVDALFYLHLNREISEYEIFEKAYESWHGHKANIKPYFDDYFNGGGTFEKNIPHWVRDYLRKEVPKEFRKF